MALPKTTGRVAPADTTPADTNPGQTSFLPPAEGTQTPTGDETDKAPVGTGTTEDTLKNGATATPAKTKEADEDLNVLLKPTSKPPVAVPHKKTVKIKPKQKHECNIGGVFYTLERGKVIDVPPNVRDILLNAGLLLPL